MRGKRRIRLTYANVVASVALFASLAGGSYAAITLPAGSVGTKQLRAGAVNSAKVKNGSLARRDFKAGELGAAQVGPQGPAGPVGPAGQAGDQGVAGRDGAPGEPGRSALDRLRTGETVRGVVGGDAEAPSGSADFADYASFPIRPGQPVGDSHMDIDGLTLPDRCTGTAEAPTAPPGVLCVYPSAKFNVSSIDAFPAVNGGGSDIGFVVRWVAPNAGDTVLEASWAYQEP